MSSKSEQLNIRISTDLKSKIQDKADTLGMSASDLIRQSLTDIVNDQTNEHLRTISELEKKYNQCCV